MTLFGQIWVVFSFIGLEKGAKWAKAVWLNRVGVRPARSDLKTSFFLLGVFQPDEKNLSTYRVFFGEPPALDRQTSGRGVPAVHQVGGHPMYIREGGTQWCYKLAYLGIYCNLLSIFRFISGYL